VLSPCAIGAAGTGAVVLALKFRGPAVGITGEKRYLDVRFDGEIPEEPASDFDALFGTPRPPLPGIVEGLTRASTDDQYRGHCREGGGPQWDRLGKVQESATP